jgi:myo-inositol catabolism protein IolH
MRILLNTNIMSAQTLEDVFRLSREAGYAGIELHPRPDFLPPFAAPSLSAEQIGRVKNYLRRYEIAVDSLELALRFASTDEAERREQVAAVKRNFEVGIELGCRRYTSEMNGMRRIADDKRQWRLDVDDDGCADAFRRSMDELMPMLEREDLLVSFECHPYDFLENSDETVDYLRRFGSRHVGYLFCTPHTFTMGGEIRPMVEYAGSLLTHVHIADTPRPERIIVQPHVPGMMVHQHLPPGDGEVDWHAFFAGLQTIGYDGPLSCCVFSHRDRALEMARRTQEWLAKQIGPQIA